MSEYVFRLPDLGEGTVEAEILEWHVAPGDTVAEADIVVDVMTDKANVEIPAPVAGTVLRTTGGPGDIVAVGSELIAFEADAAMAPRVPEPRAAPEEAARPSARGADDHATSEDEAASVVPDAASLEAASRVPGATRPRVLTSPAIRRRALEAGVDLCHVPGTGPHGRVTRADLDAFLSSDGARRPEPTASEAYEEIRVIGVRRVIAERMVASKREIPHFSYVEEVDVSELDALRRHLNEARNPDVRLTLLPFVALALIGAVRAFPQSNAHFDGERAVMRRFRHVHLGVATHTPDGLKVPVVRDADADDLWRLSARIAAAAAAARDNTARPGDLGGSTVTVTSLGRLGGIASTPIVNAPEVTIVGVNRAVKRPVVVDDAVAVRTMMNLSASFDHRFVDGFEAASMIQHMKEALEHPGSLFV